MPERPGGEVELKHVDFSYPSLPDIQVFRDLSLRARAGKTLVLVAAVLQETFLLAASINKKIAYRCEGATEATFSSVTSVASFKQNASFS